MASQKPVVVGDVYMLGGRALLKVTVSNAGNPVSGIAPLVTIIRDRDGRAANFQTQAFDTFTLASIVTTPYSAAMSEVAFGTYVYEFNPTEFASPDEEVYTVIYHHEVAPNKFVIHSEFTFTDVFGAKTTGFGFANRHTNIEIGKPVRLVYQAITDLPVRLTIYSPNNEIVVADVPMLELEDTGVYYYDFAFPIQGDHIICAHESVHDSKDCMVMTIGGDSDRLKRIESMLRQLTRNPPSVSVCGVDPCAQ